MIEPLISLAFSLYSSRGTYALLLGSGVSRAARIPTGWEVTLDLIRRLAHLHGDDPDPDPAAWFKVKIGQDPEYPVLLGTLANSPDERNALLRAYFEPTEEERKERIKEPTRAHHAIAELVQRGYIRAIITTNFDRLLEKALEGRGISPTVTSTPDAVQGAMPLTHTSCTVIKVHGDYLDARIKNTPSELAQFDPRMDALLDRLFDDFGLVVCGWSAESDVALRTAIERCASRRFTTFWCVRGDPLPQAARLIQLRGAVTIKIPDADSFLDDLAAKVFALEDYAKPHPLSARIAVATAKAHLADPQGSIRLQDLILREMESTHTRLSGQDFRAQGVDVTSEELERRLRRYEGVTEILCALMITGCYWDEGKHTGLWSRVLERIANPSGPKEGRVFWLHAHRYPALLLLYSGGIASVSGRRYQTLASLFFDARIKENDVVPIVTEVFPQRIVSNEAAQMLPGQARVYTPIHNRLFEVLRIPFKDILPEDDKYDAAFDRYEYLAGLVYADINKVQGGEAWGPVGRFGWKQRWPGEKVVMREVAEEIEAMKANWEPLRAGLFGGSIDRLLSVKAEYDKKAAGAYHY